MRPPSDRRASGWRYWAPGAALSLRKASVSPGFCCWNPEICTPCPLRGIASFPLDALDKEWRFFMSRVGLVDNSHSAPQGVADRGSRRPGIFPQAAGIIDVSFGNQCRHGQFASNPAQAAESIWEIEALSAGRVAGFAACRRYINLNWLISRARMRPLRRYRNTIED